MANYKCIKAFKSDTIHGTDFHYTVGEIITEYVYNQLSKREQKHFLKQ